MAIEEMLVNQYGPLLSINQLACVLDRSPDGLLCLGLQPSQPVGGEGWPSFDDYIAERLAVKQREYNTKLNNPKQLDEIDEEIVSDAAETYRKESDGE